MSLPLLLLLSAASTTGFTDDLETECAVPPPPPSTFSHSDFPFRTDTLTREEFCVRFMKDTDCNQEWEAPDFPNCLNASEAEFQRHPYASMAKWTFVEFGCAEETRDRMKTRAETFRRISPRRAISIAFYADSEDREEFDPINFDVVDPVRNQVIQVAVMRCATVHTTEKTYKLGDLPQALLYFLGLHCHNLVIKKAHFSRMPGLRQIQLMSATIGELEPYTFTDLPDLRSLILEDKIGNSLVARVQYAGYFDTSLLPDTAVENVRRLHCDCSFAWFRNFLKKKPYLIAAKKKGVVTMGTYIKPSKDVLSPGAFRNISTMTAREATTMDWNPVLSVDCAHEFNWRNTQAGDQFAYNTSCYNLNC
ncbi:uncharacterized protein LOC129599927 isoform X2 [Paramacrobiotus metropolitanus]|uniref:uncharacterized protein LOC129599927 isoform X2 n=1 Tax=Paramacrobiotus metropolitanus TaxID=2943436 RepID=UPI0024462A74|nr:uncharacterized protein LOC129599927 isoform X2 [Paramacrobiotus metropolitanus]